MATTRLMPLHVGKGRTTDYVKNPEKTNGGGLVSAYQCNLAIVDQEFLFVKRQYATITGRNQKKYDVIAYHLRQSFKPGEVTSELANKIGYDLAMSLTKGKHAFIVYTHVDKQHPFPYRIQFHRPGLYSEIPQFLGFFLRRPKNLRPAVLGKRAVGH